MQRCFNIKKISEEEIIKQSGLVLDYDEIARKGSMSREEGLISKWYGIYGSRQPGDHMARICNPGGKLTSVQIRAIAAMSQKYCDHSMVSFTTRQAAQVHKLQIQDLASFLRDVKAAGLTTFHGCGDVARNVTACPWASECQHRLFDVRPYAEQTAKVLTDSRDLDNLPRKYKATFSGCEGCCAQPYINCFNGIARTRVLQDGTSQKGFRVVIGGGMGWQPFVAQELFGFVPADKITALAHAVGVLFRDHGDRHIRKYARLKFVVHRLGIEACRDLVMDICVKEGLDTSDFDISAVESVDASVPDRPLCDTEPRDSNNLRIQRIMVPKGELSAKALLRIAELAEMYGDKHVYSTNRQNLELHGVQAQQIPALCSELKQLGFNTQGFFGLGDVVSCVGQRYCPLAVTHTHDVFDQLQAVVDDKRYLCIRDKVLINITGCPNSCSPFYIADIGLRGMRIREKEGSVESYQVRIGGTQKHLGLVLGEYKAIDCIHIIKTILDIFLAHTQTHPEYAGSLADHVQEVGIDPYLSAVNTLDITYDKAFNPTEYSVFTGHGDTALDFKSIAKDVPCQEACPAKTNIPEYIRLIDEGNPDAAHVINQECNVLPAVLGRICTRPCESQCRHNWTNTLGPVRICHLKRSASDTKSEASEPLPAYFESSDKTVAVIGGGPAGLAAARELKRYGHVVHLFDREKQLGGQVRSGVPAFRLPREELDQDIQAIINSGIEVHAEQTVNNERLSELLTQNDAVLVATGANTPRTLNLDGLGNGLAIEGLNFMSQYNADCPLPIQGDVIIIGGGFTAVDCARSARRLAPEHSVTIMYRRGVAQMAANEEELHELTAEDIHIETLVSPKAVTTKDGKVVAVTFMRNTLGEPGQDGRPRFIPVQDSDFVRQCGTLILAIGQTADKAVLPEGIAVAGNNLTNQNKLFVAGDFAMGNGDAINAIADGKAAADAMDTYLMGTERRGQTLRVSELKHINRIRDFDLLTPPDMPVLALDQRDLCAEVEVGFTPEQTDTQAKRCYLCNTKFEIDQDLCIHCDWCIKVSPRDCIRRLGHLNLDEDGAPLDFHEVSASEPQKATYIWIDSDQCIRCNKCADICPTNAISLRKADIENCCKVN